MNIDINSFKYRTFIELRTWKIKSNYDFVKQVQEIKWKNAIKSATTDSLQIITFLKQNLNLFIYTS